LEAPRQISLYLVDSDCDHTIIVPTPAVRIKPHGANGCIPHFAFGTGLCKRGCWILVTGGQVLRNWRG
jgi:hypothetical protein